MRFREVPNLKVARDGKVVASTSQSALGLLLHAHPAEAETFYVLEGEALFHLDGAERAMGPGSFVSVPRGVPHAFLVRSATARLLVLITPGSGAMEAFLREAGEPAPERTLPPQRPLDMERIAAAAEHTGAVTILGPPPFDEPAAR